MRWMICQCWFVCLLTIKTYQCASSESGDAHKWLCILLCLVLSLMTYVWLQALIQEVGTEREWLLSQCITVVLDYNCVKLCRIVRGYKIHFACWFYIWTFCSPGSTGRNVTVLVINIGLLHSLRVTLLIETTLVTFGETVSLWEPFFSSDQWNVNAKNVLQ